MRTAFVYCLVLLLCSGPIAWSQKNQPDDIHAMLVQGKKKSLVGYAGPDRSYTMEVPVKTSKPSDLPGFISVDGQILQSTLVPAQDPSKAPGATGALTPARQQEILTGYMNYELAYYKKKLKQKYTGLQTDWVTIKDRLFLVWSFDMPKDYKLVSSQLYFSTLYNGQILDINAPVFKMEQFGKARSILSKMAASLKMYDKRIDLALLAKKG